MMLKQFVLQNRRGLIIAAHAVLAVLAYISAFLLRFDADIPHNYKEMMLSTLPLAVGIKLIILAIYHLHEGLWRYAGISDALRLFKALLISTLVFVAVVSAWNGLSGFPRSVFVLDWVLCLFFLGAKRFSIRAFLEVRKAQTARRATDRRTLIVGAGDAGDMAVRELSKNESLRGHHIEGFLDDDLRKKGLTIHGYPVFGALSEAPRVISEESITDILVAMPTAPKRVVRELVERCSGLGVRFHILPAISDFITGRLQAQAIRTVHVEDLLGREPVKLDRSQVEMELKGARVMVTGAGGSIGSELVRQVATFSPSRLILVDSGENALFEIDHELGACFRHIPRISAICDIKHADTVERVFSAERPEYVFHAAAYKHVPLMEGHPDEAVLNNVRGTKVVAEAAARHGAKKFILISSDKAVRPVNVMGATKRVAELLLQAMVDDGPQRHGGTETACKFAAVRFGNVLGSSGSVIPIFRRQIEAGGPVTVTHPEMTRFFMTIPEAVELVLQAGALAKGGEIFVLDMGEPVRIADLARNMIELSGLEVGKDIRIEFTGARPGEKIFEELVAHGEDVDETTVPKLMIHRRDGRLRLSPADLGGRIEGLIGAALARDVEGTRRKLWETVAAHDSDVKQPSA